MSKAESSVQANVIDEFLAGLEAGDVPQRVFHADVVFDATVPNWRFSVRGATALRAELGRWYADPAEFGDLRRVQLPDGELVEFTLTWQEQGITHMCHQAHILRLENELIAADTVFCGGRWPASLIEEMDIAASG
jgi:hypothetical protein